MKALTLHQPWASLIAHEVKKIETRSWAPPGRMVGQRIAIHAGKRVVRGALSWGTRKAIADLYGPEWWDAITVGSVVCTAVLADVQRVIGHSQGVAQVTESLAGDMDRTEVEIDPHGDFDRGRYLWILGDVKVFDPVPAVGHQGLWEWEVSV